MSTRFRLLASAAVSASLSTAALAQPPALQVRMGLWEVTSITNTGGQAPAIDTSKMTPEQKARIEAAMQGMMGSRTHVEKTCITKEKFDRADFLMGDDDKGCTRTMTVNTKTTLDVAVACTGERTMTGQMHFESVSPTAMKATMRMASAAQGKPMTVNVDMTGKLLGADCGDVD